jgi:hypothetical protein
MHALLARCPLLKRLDLKPNFWIYGFQGRLPPVVVNACPSVTVSKGNLNDQIWPARMRADRQVLLEVLLEVRGDRTRDVQP